MDEQDIKKIESTDKNSLHFRIDTERDDTAFCDRVKTLVNRVDILGSDRDFYHTGLQPEKMVQTDFLRTGECLIGMCHYRKDRHHPYYVDISISDDMVIWDDPQAKCQYKFDKTEYTLAIKKLQKMLTDYLSGNPYKPTKEDLEEYKKAVYEYLTEKMRENNATVKIRMKAYETFFEEYLEEHWSVSSTATVITLYFYEVDKQQRINNSYGRKQKEKFELSPKKPSL